MPGGTAVARTAEAVGQAEDILRREEAVADFTSVIGLNFIDNYSQPNAAHAQTVRGAQGSLSWRARVDCATWCQVPGGPGWYRGPPFAATNSRSWYRWRLHLRSTGSAGRRPQGTGPSLARPHGCRQGDPQLTRVFSTFSATNPSIYLDIDRNKVEVLGVQLTPAAKCRKFRRGSFILNLPSHHSITSSAATRSVSGTVRPSALAALRLMTSRYIVGC
jgi:hypothetical protein